MGKDLFDSYISKIHGKKEALTSKKSDFLKKYGIYIMIIAGIFVMLIGSGIFSSNPPPVSKQPAAMSEEEYIKLLEGRLEQSISQIEGVGKVHVMITLKNSREIVVAAETKTNEQSSKDDTRANISSNRESKLVIIKDQPLIIKEIEPTLEGVMIVAEGAANMTVKEKINIAAKTLLGVEPHKIAVFQLKKGR